MHQRPGCCSGKGTIRIPLAPSESLGPLLGLNRVRRVGPAGPWGERGGELEGSGDFQGSGESQWDHGELDGSQGF